MGINEPSMLVGSADSSSSRVFSSYHRGGGQFAMADGSVRGIGPDVSLDTLSRLGNRRDGQAIAEAW